MNRPVNIFVYLGTGKEGNEMEKKIHRATLQRNFVKKNGKPNVSPFVVHCINYTIKQEKLTGKGGHK